MGMREEFEAWWNKQTSIDPYIKGDMWGVWQASRAALVIELPESSASYSGVMSAESGDFDITMMAVDVENALTVAGVPHK